MRLTTGDKKLAAAFDGSRDFFAARASGNHLAAQNDEPEPLPFTEAALIAGDRERVAAKAADPFRQADADRAMHAELHQMRCMGLL